MFFPPWLLIFVGFLFLVFFPWLFLLRRKLQRSEQFFEPQKKKKFIVVKLTHSPTRSESKTTDRQRWRRTPPGFGSAPAGSASGPSAASHTHTHTHVDAPPARRKPHAEIDWTGKFAESLVWGHTCTHVESVYVCARRKTATGGVKTRKKRSLDPGGPGVGIAGAPHAQCRHSSS